MTATLATTQDSVKKGIVATVAYALVMSVTAMGARIVQEDVAVSVLVFWQSLFCVAVLLPQQKGHWRAHPFSVWKIHLLRSLGGFAGFLFYYQALNHIPLVEASLLRSCAPLCVPFVVLLVHHVRIPAVRWIPLVIGFIGVGLIIQPTPDAFNPWHLVGFLSAVGLAFSMVTTRMLSKSVRGQETMLVYFAISSLLSFLLLTINGESLYIPSHQILWLLVVSVTLYVGMKLYTQAYTYAPASLVSPVSYIGVVFSGGWGWLVWGHVPDGLALTGMVLIFISILISARLVRSG